MFRKGVRAQTDGPYEFRFRDVPAMLVFGPPVLLFLGISWLWRQYSKSNCTKYKTSAPAIEPKPKRQKKAQPVTPTSDDKATLAALRAISTDGKVSGTQEELGRAIERSASAVNRATQHARSANLARVKTQRGRGGRTEIEFLN